MIIKQSRISDLFNGEAEKAKLPSDSRRLTEQIEENVRHQRVKGGTPIGDPSNHLCQRCDHSQIIKGFAAGHEIVYCSYFNEKLPWPVYECSVFKRKGELSLQALGDMAKLIDIKVEKKMGFVTEEEEDVQEQS